LVSLYLKFKFLINWSYDINQDFLISNSNTIIWARLTKFKGPSPLYHLCK
jgi:hypothetical protein